MNPTSSPVGSTAAPAGLPKAVVILMGAAAAVIMVAGMRSASGLVGHVLLSMILTVAVLPLGRWAQRKGWPTWSSVILMMVGVYAILLILVGGVAYSIAKLIGILPQYAPKAQDLVNSLSAQLNTWGIDTSTTKTSVSDLSVDQLVSVLNHVLDASLSIASALMFIIVVLFFMTADAFAISQRGAAFRQAQPKAAQVMLDFAHGTQRYLIVSAIFGAIVAVLDTAALYLLGVPLALTWGLLSFLTNFIPNIGFVLGLIPPAILALLDSGWKGLLSVVIAYSVLNVVIQTFIQPRYVGDSVGINPTTTFIALAFWAFILGPLGALLAVPTTLLIRAIFIDSQSSNHWMLLLIGSSQAESGAEAQAEAQQAAGNSAAQPQPADPAT